MQAVRPLLAGWLALMLASTPVMASPSDHPFLPMAQHGHSGNEGISLDEAVLRARQQYRGKVLSAETVRVDGRKAYRIKILTQDGRVERIHIDARTGQVLSRR
ncbi:MAG: PepSY domain-containing protein [Sedimenticolaceae bacterium]